MKAIKNTYTFGVRILNGLFITGILFIFLSSCESKNTANTRLQSQVFEEKPIDTTVVKYFSFPDFQFYIKKTNKFGQKLFVFFIVIYCVKTQRKRNSCRRLWVWELHELDVIRFYPNTY